ncbi:hypothetical protein GCM10028864_67020 [Microlunatus parietis]
MVSCGTDSGRHVELAARGPFDVIVDATGAPADDRLRRFRRIWFHLARGGRYCFRTADPGSGDRSAEIIRAYLDRLIAHRDPASAATDLRKEERAIAASIRRTAEEQGTVMITCGRPALPKLREVETERVLAARPDLGSVLIKKPGRGLGPGGSLRSNLEPQVVARRSDERVSEVQLREYRDVLVCPHQVLLGGGLVLPDSFRHFTKRRLRNRYLDEATPWFARYPGDLSEPQRLAGSYFYLSSEVPGHFGHLMTEQLSRMWAWSAAVERHPGLKALLQPADGRIGPAGFEREVLSAAGVGEHDIVSPVGVLRVERLLAATPMLVDPTFIHPELPEVWRRAGTNLLARAPERDSPERIFVSRGPNFDRRPCRNLTEVEEFVTRHGYTVLYPEDYGVAEQAMIFNRAERIAGFAGSGMFSLIFCAAPKPVILIAPESYTARNEYLIASALGHRITQLWCDPEVAHPEAGWDAEAYRSAFRVDLVRDGDFLADALTSDW